MRTKRSLTLMLGAFAFASLMGEVRGSAPDLDGDGIPNIVDPDIDGDGIPNALDKNVDGGIAQSGPFAGQYVGDHLNNDNPAEDDIDGDDLADDSLGETDIDGDSLPDKSIQEKDTDGDGRPNASGAERDMDGDGRRNDDADEDDQDGDGDDDREDSDDDNDGEEDDDDLDHHPEEDEREVERGLAATANAPAGSEAKVEVQRFGSGKVEFSVEAQGLPVGSFEIVVAGVVRGVLEVVSENGETEGETEFETNPNKPDELNLDFDVFGETVSLELGGAVYFAGTIPSPPVVPGGEGEQSDGNSADVDLTPAAGLGEEAAAQVEVKYGLLGGAVVVEIQVESVPAGGYEVLIGGVQRGSLAVEQDGEGYLVFDADSGDPEKLPLNFSAAGEVMVISQGGVPFFSGTIPPGPTP